LGFIIRQTADIICGSAILHGGGELRSRDATVEAGAAPIGRRRGLSSVAHAETEINAVSMKVTLMIRIKPPCDSVLIGDQQLMVHQALWHGPRTEGGRGAMKRLEPYEWWCVPLRPRRGGCGKIHPPPDCGITFSVERTTHETRYVIGRGLKAMGLELPAPARAQLVAFVRLLEKWNRQYNLTAVRDPEQMIPRHVLDSLSVLPFIKGARVLDIGTGAGLPGIPLAIARPDLTFMLLDSNAKKLAFVRQALHGSSSSMYTSSMSAWKNFIRKKIRYAGDTGVCLVVGDRGSSTHLVASNGCWLA